MANVQVPPPVGTSGQAIDALIINAATSELRQIHIVADPVSSSAMATVTTSGGLSVNVTNLIRSLSSGTITLSSVPTVTATAATNPWSSAPGFNIPMVSASSGFMQISGTAVIVSASSGLVQISGNVTSTATTVTSGTVTLSSVHTVTATAGTNPWSSAPGFNVPMVSASSGLVQISGTAIFSLSSGTVTLSSVHTVTATAGTNPWSSAPGFNVPIVNASSGRVGTFPSTGQQYTVYHLNASSSNSITVVATGPISFYGWNVGNQTTGTLAAIKIYNSSSSPTIGTTTLLVVTIPIPGSTAGAGNNFILPQGMPLTAGLSFTITNNFSATSTGTSHSKGDVVGQLYYI